MSISELKQTALSKLNGKKGNAALLVLVVGLLTGIVTTIANTLFPGTKVYKEVANITVTSQNPVATLIVTAFMVFITLGVTSYFLKTVRDENVELGEIFTKGKLFPKAFVSSLIVDFLISLGLMFLVIPGIIIALSYALVPFLYVDNPEIGITEVLKKSSKMMKGHLWELFCLMLSFIGWVILGVFTLGILYFWLIPYIHATVACFYEKLKNENVNTVEPVETNN